MKHLPSALLAAASTCVSGAAMAAAAGPDRDIDLNRDVVQVRTEVIEYDASEIRDRRSAQRLFFQIRRAAEDVCRLSSHPVGYELWDERACEREAVSEAVDDTDLPELEELYFGRSGAGASLR